MPNSNNAHTDEIKNLIELNDELENYFRNTIIPQLFVDANLILRKYTPPAMKQFKFTQDHIGRPMIELIDNIRYSTIMDNIQEVISTGEIFEKEIQTTDRKWFQMNIIPYLVKKENKANGVIITFIDITDRIKDLREMEKLNASHETFIFAVSHDLKAPLANIEGLVQILLDNAKEMVDLYGADTKEQQFIAEKVEVYIKLMKNIINDLSEIAKIEGKYKETVEPVSFENIFKEVEMTIKDQINSNNAKITFDIKVAEIEFSRKNLRSIIYNLLSNAIKFKSAENVPMISVKTEMDKDFILISVTDNGIGMTELDKESIFTQYTRHEKNIEGTGIGLYLVKKIVENAGGMIHVNTALGQGTEFKVYLKPIAYEN